MVACVEPRRADRVARADVDLSRENVIGRRDPLLTRNVKPGRRSPTVEAYEHAADFVIPHAIVTARKAGAERQPAVFVEEKIAIRRVRGMLGDAGVQCVRRDVGRELPEVARGGTHGAAELTESVVREPCGSTRAARDRELVARRADRKRIEGHARGGTVGAGYFAGHPHVAEGPKAFVGRAVGPLGRGGMKIRRHGGRSFPSRSYSAWVRLDCRGTCVTWLGRACRERRATYVRRFRPYSKRRPSVRQQVAPNASALVPKSIPERIEFRIQRIGAIGGVFSVVDTVVQPERSCYLSRLVRMFFEVHALTLVLCVRNTVERHVLARAEATRKLSSSFSSSAKR